MTAALREFSTPCEAFDAYASVNLIGGERCAALATLDVVNPATGDVLGHAAASSAEETANAVSVAKEAQKSWAATPARDRGKAGRRQARGQFWSRRK